MRTIAKYFFDCVTAEDLKKAYKKWAKALHPDNGGDKSKFQEMQNEFSEMWETMKSIHITKDGEQYEKDTDETAQDFMDMMAELLRMEGVRTEICGKWIWCSGNTKVYKETLKKLRFRWSKSKEAWYYHREPYHKWGKGEYSMDDIREMYGSRTYQKVQFQEQLA